MPGILKLDLRTEALPHRVRNTGQRESVHLGHLISKSSKQSRCNSAVAGNRRANIAGIGLHGATIKELCRSYPSLEALRSAAANGKLSMWPKHVQRMLLPGTSARTVPC